MQSNTAIALFTKMKMLFEKDNKFLAFPPGAISWKCKDFSFVDMDKSTGTALSESLRLAANFAKSFNFIADTSTKLSYDDRNLWDVYKTVLTQKILAKGSRTPEEQQRIQQLRDYLLLPAIDREDGTRISRQDNHDIYQSKYYELVTDYNIKKFTAENSTDANDKNLWAIQEPGLKVKVDTAMNDWMLKGLKNEVKNANDELSSLSGKGPFTTWAEYQTELDRAKFTKTELGGAVDFDFYGTLFYPADFYQEKSTSWNTFTLNKSEIAALCEKAPDELKVLTSDVLIKSLTAEIAYVDLRRPWLHSEIFTDRTWDLPDGEISLSDGGNPAAGRIPAFPVAIIFARNLKVEMENATGPIQPGTRFTTIINQKLFTNLSAIPIEKATHLTQPQPQIMMFRTQVAKPVATAAPQPRAFVRARMITPEPPRAQVVKTDLLRFSPQKQAVATPQTLNRMVFTDRIKLFQANTVKKELQNNTPPPPPPPEAEIEILAFVCQRVPLSPNPDQALPWS